MSTDFKYTGHPQPARTANLSGSGIAIAGPGAAKYITIFDVLASEPTLLRENDGVGPVVAYIPSGAASLTASITGGISNGTGHAILSTAGNVTITYSIQTADWL
jgi:hypothetical protein|tara:strand:- start:236 stop:547 length:312 start_codon:yes stop_codon:yes gene_type:complete